MIVDGASSHKAKDLTVPENIRLVPLPAYAPELNPQEHVWDDLREKEFPNRVFSHITAVIGQLHPDFPKNYTYAMPGSWISKALRISRCAFVTSVRI